MNLYLVLFTPLVMAQVTQAKANNNNMDFPSVIQGPVGTALLAIGTGFVGAAVTYFYNNKKAEQDSRRNYESEARARLYNDCEPILFQIIELSDTAYKLIKFLAEATMEGKFGPPKNPYFVFDHYMMKSTIFRLLAPLAAFKLLQSSLTTIDLRLDQKINLQYLLAKKLYNSFADDDKISRLGKSNNQLRYYNPIFGNTPEVVERRDKNPQIYKKQGFTFGRLEKLALALITKDHKGNRRIMTYSEFENEFFSKKPENIESKKPENIEGINLFKIPSFVFYGFHPNKRPVLWRILVTQARIYKTLIYVSRLTEQDVRLLDPAKIKTISKMDEKLLDWHQSNSNEVVFDNDLYGAVETYLQKEFDDLFSIIPFKSSRISEVRKWFSLNITKQ
jgi:hypothetical protein